MKPRSYLFPLACLVLTACGGGGGNGGAPGPAAPPPQQGFQPGTTFVEDTGNSGISRVFDISAVSLLAAMSDPQRFGGGLAVVDIDTDSDLDLYLVAGDGTANQLYRNDGGNQFTDIAAAIGLDLMHQGSGPAFGDIDGDGDPDLFVGAVNGDAWYLLRNDAGLYVDITATSGITISAENTVSAGFGDHDLDGDLDLVLAHWGHPGSADTQTLWENNGDGTFFSASIASGLAGSLLVPADGAPPGQLTDYTFAPMFTDLDDDGDPDFVVAADFNTSQVFRNEGNGTYTRTTDPNVIVDDSGMGSAVGDYDNDGDMDWFVTAIYEDPSQPNAHIGNRLYRNDGTGTFEDVTDVAGVANGGWGWGACMEDFDNDGDLDIFHVNGFDSAAAQEFLFDTARYFENQNDGTFVEAAAEAGVDSAGQGRGVACFDSDRDGDLDIFISNNDFGRDTDDFYINQSDASNNYIAVKLAQCGRNSACIGARVSVTAGGREQVREIRAGNNYVSQNTAEAHFGLGAAASADMQIRWPDGSVSNFTGLPVNQLHTIVKP